MLRLLKKVYESLIDYSESYNEYRISRMKKTGTYGGWY